MHARARLMVIAVALATILVACAEPKDTGLPQSPSPEPKSQTRIEVVDSAFRPATLNVKTGEVVTFEWMGSAPHNARFTTIKLDSHPTCVPSGTGCSSAGAEPFKAKFDKAGEYPYYCVVHGTPAGQGMAGKIVVA